MKIDEAIATNVALKLNIANENIGEAIQLGIEALERLEAIREISTPYPIWAGDKLPSETEGG